MLIALAIQSHDAQAVVQDNRFERMKERIFIVRLCQEIDDLDYVFDELDLLDDQKLKLRDVVKSRPSQIATNSTEIAEDTEQFAQFREEIDDILLPHQTKNAAGIFVQRFYQQKRYWVFELPWQLEKHLSLSAEDSRSLRQASAKARKNYEDNYQQNLAKILKEILSRCPPRLAEQMRDRMTADGPILSLLNRYRRHAFGLNHEELEHLELHLLRSLILELMHLSEFAESLGIDVQQFAIIN